MDYVKIQTEAIKAYMKFQNGKMSKVPPVDASLPSRTFIADVKGTVGYLIPDSLCVLDTTKFSNINAAKLFEAEDQYTPARITEYRTGINGELFAVIRNDDGYCLVNKKLLANFEPEAEFKILKKYLGVLVYEWGTLVGIVMPARVTEIEKELDK